MKTEERFRQEPEKSFLLFRLDRQTYAVALEQVERVERIVEIRPLPNAARGVAGIINYHGQPLAVMNLRELFQLPLREWRLEDVLVLLNVPGKIAAFIADQIDGVVTWRSENVVRLQHENMTGIHEVIRYQAELIYICDLSALTTDPKTELAATGRSVAADGKSGSCNEDVGERIAGANQSDGGAGVGTGVCGGTLA